jgi:type IV secretory pathway VirB10-like protein
MGTVMIGLVAVVRGFETPNAAMLATGGLQPVEPQAPTSPNLEVSDLVKNAPGNDAPLPILRAPAPPAPAANPSAGEGTANTPARPGPGIPDLSQPPQGEAAAQSQQAPTLAQEARLARIEARRAAKAKAMASSMFGDGEGFDTGPTDAAAAARSGPGGAVGPRAAGNPAAAADGEGPQVAAPGGRGEDPDQAGQAQKHAFLRGAQDGQRDYTVTFQSPNHYRMRAGWIIPCVLNTAVNTDLPGMVTAMVTENVYDSETGDHLLVPQGASVTAKSNSSVGYGQERAQVCWNLLQRDDGITVDFGCSPAYDRSGASGLSDKVNNHYGKLITGVVLSALLSAGTQAIAGDMQNYRPSVTQGFAIGAASEFGSAGQQITRQNLNVQATLEVRNGFPAVIILEKPVALPVYRKKPGAFPVLLP